MNNMATSNASELAETTFQPTFGLDAPIKCLSPNEIILIWVASGAVWSFGVVANVTTFLALCRMRQTPLNIIIMGLCCSDILSVIVSPFIVKQMIVSCSNEEYPWDIFVCKTLFPAAAVASGVTILLVLALSIWRFRVIRSGHKANDIMTLKRARALVISIWLIVVIVIMPLPAYYLEIVRSPWGIEETCIMKPSNLWLAHIYHFIELILVTFAPISCIVILCSVIGILLIQRKLTRQDRTADESFRETEKQALIQLAAIVACFFIGYIPKFFYGIWYYVGIRSRRSHAIVYLVSRWIVNLSESINPIIYNVASKDLRTSVKKVVGKFPTSVISLAHISRARPREQT